MDYLREKDRETFKHRSGNNNECLDIKAMKIE